ncbi:ABC transporter ATP-binding protein [Microvirga sp. 2TAF3]|uniref:ABC transporter ATP-binding protein n=1 Tax=Microvirga sp. 2TAF3 TaxID=3233014 RepID=UPI003F98EAC2
MMVNVEPLLRVNALHVSFETSRGSVRAVDGVDLEVRAGEVLGLVGESGSGKSVTLRSITRILHPNARVSGQVFWRGEDLLHVPETRLQAVRGAEIAMIFQEPMTALNPVLTIGLQIDEALVAHTTLSRAARRKRAVELLDHVGIPSAAERLGNYPHEFSGGMRQRAMIAIALAAEPKLLLADEPTTALDVTIQDQILKLLLRLVDEMGMAMILVTHDLGVVAETCSQVAVMYAGRIAEAGPVEAIFHHPRHAYTRALLNSMPDNTAARVALKPIPGQPPRLDRPIPGCPFLPRCTWATPPCELRPPLVAIAPGHVSACTAAHRLPSRIVPA